MSIVYLAGPMQNCTDSEMNAWRSLFKRELEPAFSILDPTRRDYRGDVAWLPDKIREIVENDKGDIQRSAIVVANCWKPSHGTSMEIIYAHGLGKRVLVIHPGAGGSGGDRPSPWLIYHSERIFRTAEECVQYLKGGSG